MSTTHTIRTLETIAEGMKNIVERTTIYNDYCAFEQTSEPLRMGWYNMWVYKEWQIMQCYGINEFNALDVRRPK